MINLSQKNIVKIANSTNFIKDNIEKVLRLCDILEMLFVSRWKDKLVLKGGTAINLGYLQMPRLSVDIDLDYIVLDRATMLADKVKIKDFLLRAMFQKGYSMSPSSKEYFALDSFVFNFVNNADNKDNIKIEINFMDRVHIFESEPIKIQNAVIQTDIEIPMLEKNELFATKLAALIDRTKPRDLYDAYGLINANLNFDSEILRKCTIFYNALAGKANLDSFSFEKFDIIDKRAITTMLKPVLTKTDKFDHNKAAEQVKEFLQNLFCFTDNEKQFLHEFRNKSFAPHLVFEDEKISERIKNHPMAIWKTKE